MKERKVSLYLLLLLTVLMPYLYWWQAPSFFLWEVMLNLVLSGIIVLGLWVYSRYKLKAPFINNTFGMGDLWFLLVVALSFPTYVFLTTLVFGLLLALLLHQMFHRKSSHQVPVPLAGYLGLFYFGLYLADMIGWVDSLYS